MTRFAKTYPVGMSALFTCRAVFLSAAVVFALSLTGCGMIKGKEAAEKAVTEFHERLDRGAYHDIYTAAHAEFKAATTEQDFSAILEAMHRKLGAVQSVATTGWNANSVNLKTNIVLGCKTKFAQGEGVETFTFRIEGDRPVLLGYDINSKELITK